MQAMIFAAGLGTRLFPLTRTRPKALAPFVGRTLLEFNLKFLAAQGVEKFVINTHHFADDIYKYLADNNNFELDISISKEKTLLNTAGGLAKALPLFKPGKEPILIFNVDVITNINLSGMVGMFEKSIHTDIILAVRKRNSSRYLLFDQQNRLCGWKNIISGKQILNNDLKSELTELAFSGISVFSRKALEKLETERIYSLTDFLLENMDTLQIESYIHNGDYWFDCGKPDKLKDAENLVKGLLP